MINENETKSGIVSIAEPLQGKILDNHDFYRNRRLPIYI